MSEENKNTETEVSTTEESKVLTQSTEATKPTEPTQPTEPTTPPAPDNNETNTPPEINEESIEKTLKEKGLNYQELLEEYADKGDLTEETRTKLSKLGFTNEFINDFIEGKKALVEQQVKKEQEELASYIGGKEVFDNVINWAAKNMSNEEKLALNQVRNMETQKLILEGLKARMEKDEGVLPSFIHGGGQDSKPNIFENQAQMFEAIRDKRYNTDPAYQDEVTKKIEASRKAGINLGI